MIETEIIGPPDVEERIGLTGGNIFQGDTLPDQMWDRRLESRTPIEGGLPLRRRPHGRRDPHLGMVAMALIAFAAAVRLFERPDLVGT